MFIASCHEGKSFIICYFQKVKICFKTTGNKSDIAVRMNSLLVFLLQPCSTYIDQCRNINVWSSSSNFKMCKIFLCIKEFWHLDIKNCFYFVNKHNKKLAVNWKHFNTCYIDFQHVTSAYLRKLYRNEAESVECLFLLTGTSVGMVELYWGHAGDWNGDSCQS